MPLDLTEIDPISRPTDSSTAFYFPQILVPWLQQHFHQQKEIHGDLYNFIGKQLLISATFFNFSPLCFLTMSSLWPMRPLCCRCWRSPADGMSWTTHSQRRQVTHWPNSLQQALLPLCLTFAGATPTDDDRWYRRCPELTVVARLQPPSPLTLGRAKNQPQILLPLDN